MSKNKFALGDRVAENVTKDNRNFEGLCEYKVGAIKADKVHGKPDHYIVQWDPRWKGDKSAIEEVHSNLLISEAEADVKAAALETEFTALEKMVKDKLNIAAKALDEATKLAAAAGFSLSDLHEANSNLMNAMDNAGWRTSSLHC